MLAVTLGREAGSPLRILCLGAHSDDIELGCSPRAALALTHASRARAFIHGRDYVIPEDIFALADDVVLHRMRLTYEALAQGKTAQGVLHQLLARMA